MVKLLAKFQTRLYAAITASATAIVVDSVTSIPAVPFMAVIGAGTKVEEAVLVTAITTATKSLTVTRAQRSTTAVAHGVHQLFHHSEIEFSDLKQKETFSAAGHGLHIEHTFTYVTTGALKSLQIDQTYQPVSDSGYGSPIPIAAKVTLGESAVFEGGQAGMYAVQAQLNFLDGATLNQTSSIFAALRGVITVSGTPIYSAFEGLCGLFIDIQGSIDMSGIAGLFKSSGIFLQNGASAYMDAAIRVLGGGWDNLINFDGANRGGNEGIIHTGGGYEGSYLEASVLVDGVEHRIRLYKAS